MENFQKGGFRNRCRIAGPNGPLLLTVPLQKGKHKAQPIQEVQIDYRKKWARQHWQSIQTAYGKAPFFDFYAEAIQHCYESPPIYLWEWQARCRSLIKGFIPLSISFSETELYLWEWPDETLDLRNRIRSSSETVHPWFIPAAYPQLFRERYGFLPNLSILDLLFCTGPQAEEYLLASVQRPKVSGH